MPWTCKAFALHYYYLSGLICNRHNNKPVDLSLTIRLSGLSPGARLELVLVSRSPSVVSVALQLPDLESSGIPNGRLVDKFPSNTTLWLILRHFESGTPSGTGVKNFTQRGGPQTASGDSGAGRLFHYTPVLQVIGRELSAFQDLQKTLGQLGINSGTALLRLSFRSTSTPLEEAMEQITSYFKSVAGEESTEVREDSLTNSESIPQASQPVVSEELQESRAPDEPSAMLEPVGSADGREDNINFNPSSSLASPIADPGQRAISVFAPPSSTVPQAARQAFNEADYEPTIDHAKRHQARLATSSRNQRLLTDKEIASQEEMKAQKVAEIKDIQIKVRFPDQSSAVMKFSSQETAENLYDAVKGMLKNEAEPFLLSFTAPGGPKTIPRNSKDELIGKLGMKGSTLVNFVWAEGASATTKSGKILKQTYAEQAKQIEVKDIEGVDVKYEAVQVSGLGKGKEKERDGRKGQLPRWMKLPGKN